MHLCLQMLVSSETATAVNGKLGHGDVELGVSKPAVPKVVAEAPPMRPGLNGTSELPPLDQESADGGKAFPPEALNNRQPAILARAEDDESAALLRGSQVLSLSLSGWEPHHNLIEVIDSIGMS